MKLLAIDTSTKFLSVAIANDGDILASVRDTGEMQHSSQLVPSIDRTLKKCNLKLKDVDAIALSIGPGSFTGLRIGVATCKGINLALGIPIVSVPTLDAIAYNFIKKSEKILCPLIDAKKQKLYTCFYAKSFTTLGLKRITDYILTDIEGFLKMVDKPTMVFGDGVKLYLDYLKKNSYIDIVDGDWFPKAEVVAKLGLEKARKRKFENPDKLVPLYLHSKYCQVRV